MRYSRRDFMRTFITLPSTVLQQYRHSVSPYPNMFNNVIIQPQIPGESTTVGHIAFPTNG